MNRAQNCKFFSITPPAAIADNTSPATTELDTLGFDYLQIFVYYGAMDIATTALKVTESDVTASGHADVTGLIFGTSADIAGTTSTLPTALNDNTAFLFEIDLRGRKRFIDVTLTVGDGDAGTYVTAFAIAHRFKDAPVTAAERGLTQILRV